MRTPASIPVLGALVAFLLVPACGGGSGGSTVDPAVVLHTESVPDGQTGVAYATTFQASFANPPGRFVKAAGLFPPGLELEQTTGELSGYPSQVGTFRFEIEARDGPERDVPRDVTFPADRKRFTLRITKGAPNFIPPFELPTAEYRASYTHVFDIRGGTPPYRTERAGGELPSGLAVTTTGRVSGVPTAARQDPYVFQVRLTDAEGN